MRSDRGGPATEATHLASSWPSLGYGELEDLLIELSGGEKRSVIGRFRNLRQMPFPDAIRTGIGNRVEYDLPRLLAICCAFELNALLLPQSHAVAIVRDCWPELVRGFIGAAVAAEHLDRPEHMPQDLSGVVSILPDGFASADQPLATATVLTLKHVAAGPGGAGTLQLDCAGLMALISRRIMVPSRDPIPARVALNDLNRTFGWGPGDIPRRASIVDLLDGANFLDQGPYLTRAEAFLRLAASLIDARQRGVPPRRRSLAAAQNLLRYLESPAPIDEWKGEIGSEEGHPRVKHQLAAIGKMAGLEVTVRWPAILMTAGGSAVGEISAMIASALRSERAARANWATKARVSGTSARNPSPTGRKS